MIFEKNLPWGTILKFSQPLRKRTLLEKIVPGASRGVLFPSRGVLFLHIIDRETK